MAISRELMLAILAMDSYDRGYDRGLDVQAAGASATQIGNASLGFNSTQSAAGVPNGQAAGFFAQSYTWNGQTIISYRGTDTPT